MTLSIQPLYAPCDVHGTFLHFRFQEEATATVRSESAPPHSCFLDVDTDRVQEEPAAPARVDDKRQKTKQKKKKRSKETRKQEEEIEWRDWRSQALRETWETLTRKLVTKDKDDCLVQGRRKKQFLHATLTNGGQRHLLIRSCYMVMQVFCLTRIRVLRQIPGSDSYEVWSTDEMMEKYPQVNAIVDLAKEIQKHSRSRFFVHTAKSHMPVTYLPRMTVAQLSRVVGIRNATKKIWKLDGKDLPVSSINNTMGALKVKPGDCVEVL